MSVMYGVEQLLYWPSRCAVAFATDLRSRILRWTGKSATQPVVQPRDCIGIAQLILWGNAFLISCVLCDIKWRGKTSDAVKLTD